jgi:hypothetical protein
MCTLFDRQCKRGSLRSKSVSRRLGRPPPLAGRLLPLAERLLRVTERLLRLDRSLLRLDEPLLTLAESCLKLLNRCLQSMDVPCGYPTVALARRSNACRRWASPSGRLDLSFTCNAIFLFCKTFPGIKTAWIS